MEISKDTQKNTEKLYLDIFGSIIKEAHININEIPVIELIRRETPVTQYPWATLANLENRIFTEYFCSTDTFTVKAEAKSKFGSHIKIKEVWDQGRNHNIFSHQWNFRIPLGERNQASALDCKISSNDFKLVFNHGYLEYKGLRLYFNQELGLQKGSRNHNFKLGFTAVWNNIGSDNRIKIDQDRNLTLNTKFISTFNRCRLGLLGTFDLSRKVIVQKSFYLGYLYKDIHFNFKADQAFGRRTLNYGDVRQWFNHVSLTSIYKAKPSIRVGLQLNGFPQSNKGSFAALIEHTVGGSKGQRFRMHKLKLDSSLTLSALLRYQYNSKFTFSVGCKIPFYDRKQINKFGVRVDINA